MIPPPQQGTPPTAYMGHGSDMKFGMDVSIDNNFVTIRADFGISIFELSNSAKQMERNRWKEIDGKTDFGLQE